MKTNVLSFLVLLLFSIPFYAWSQQQVPTRPVHTLKAEAVGTSELLVDNRTDYQWNDTVKQWQLAYKSEFEYTADNDLSLFIGYTRNDADSWDNNSKEEYTYATSHKPSTIIQYLWNDTANAWVPSGKIMYQYDTVWNITSIEYYNWDETSETLELTSSETYTYTGNSLLQEWISSENVNNELNEVEKELYQYDDKGNMLESTSLTKDMNNSWINVSRSIFTYNDENLAETWNGEVWDYDNSVWTGTYQEEYGYDGNGNRVTQTTYETSSGTAVLISKTEHSFDDTLLLGFNKYVWNASSETWSATFSYAAVYNEYGNKTEESESGWDVELNEWIGYKTIEYEYDEEQRLFSEKKSLYNKNTQTWDSMYYKVSYYSQAVTNPTTTNNTTEPVTPTLVGRNKISIQLYPNPVSALLYIAVNESANSVVAVYNQNGTCVYSSSFTADIQIDVNLWSPGLYQYQIISGSGSAHGTFVKQ